MQAWIGKDGALTLEGVSDEELAELAGDLLPEPRQHITLDEFRDKWGEGPWQHEPDREQWVDSETSLVCLIRRGHHGAWCFYVGVPWEHGYHGRQHDNIHATCHGSLNYSAPCDGDPENGICHVPEPGEPDDLWWFGGSCTTIRDYTPLYDQGMEPREQYKPIEYARDQATKLARQLV